MIVRCAADCVMCKARQFPHWSCDDWRCARINNRVECDACRGMSERLDRQWQRYDDIRMDNLAKATPYLKALWERDPIPGLLMEIDHLADGREVLLYHQDPDYKPERGWWYRKSDNPTALYKVEWVGKPACGPDCIGGILGRWCGGCEEAERWLEEKPEAGTGWGDFSIKKKATN
jgi:hypothetical protein